MVTKTAEDAGRIKASILDLIGRDIDRRLAEKSFGEDEYKLQYREGTLGLMKKTQTDIMRFD